MELKEPHDKVDFPKNCRKAKLFSLWEMVSPRISEVPPPFTWPWPWYHQRVLLALLQAQAASCFHCYFPNCAHIHYLTWFLPGPCEVGRTTISFPWAHFWKMPRTQILHNCNLTDLAAFSHANKIRIRGRPPGMNKKLISFVACPEIWLLGELIYSTVLKVNILLL